MKRKQQKVRVGPFDYTIEIVKDLKNGDNMLDGQIRYGETRIRLGDHLNEQTKRQTLWHEIVHGIATQNHVKMGEMAVDIMAMGIMQVLRDNPWLGK